MKIKIKELIAEAEKILDKKAFDAAHDVTHHQQVWANAQQILAEVEEEVDLTALQIAAMWHDVVIDKKWLGKKIAKHRTANYVSKRMKNLSFSPATIKKTRVAILQHSVNDTQTIIESKILADADLLEWFNIERFLKILQIYSSGKGAKIKKIALKKFAKKWIHKIPNLMHFEITRKFYHQKLADFKKDIRVKKAVFEKYGGEKFI